MNAMRIQLGQIYSIPLGMILPTAVEVVSLHTSLADMYDRRVIATCIIRTAPGCSEIGAANQRPGSTVEVHARGLKLLA